MLGYIWRADVGLCEEFSLLMCCKSIKKPKDEIYLASRFFHNSLSLS